MALILRSDIGRKLTTSELDGNFTYLDNKPSGGSSGGYQVLGSLLVDLTLATQSLTYPILYVVTSDSDPQFAEGDFVEAGDGIIVTGTASIYSIVFDSTQNGRDTSIYRIELTDVQGIIYDPLGNKNNLICQASGANGEMATYYDSMGPEQEITLVGDYNVVKSILLFNASGDISESGELVVSTGEKRSGKELLNTFIKGDPDSEILQSFTNSNVFLEYGVDSKDASNLISNTLYVTVNKPINSGELTLNVYGYSLDSFI